MKSLDERLTLAKIILRELSKEPLPRCILEKRTTHELGTHATFEGMFQWLFRKGCIEKSGLKRRDFYRLSNRGRKLLEGLP